MLIVLIGPPGVGKTTIMNELKCKHGWKIIPTFHTRKKRLGEIEKISLDQEEFDKLIKLKFFFSVQNVSNYYYGQPMFYIEQALQSEGEYWIFDIAISHIMDFINTKAKIFYILPSSIDQLRSQLEKAHRQYKIHDSILDYSINYVESSLNKNIPVIENEPYKLLETVKKILDLI